jgi:hypothetical protein
MIIAWRPFLRTNRLQIAVPGGRAELTDTLLPKKC